MNKYLLKSEIVSWFMDLTHKNESFILMRNTTDTYLRYRMKENIYLPNICLTYIMGGG